MLQTKLVNELGIVKKVPNDYKECSCCGKYYPLEDYCKKSDDDTNKTMKTRTNCYICYNLPWNAMKLLEEHTSEFKKSYDYRKASDTIRYIVNNINTAISRDNLIEILKKLPDNAMIRIKIDNDYQRGDTICISDTPEQFFEYDDKIYYSLI